MAWESQSSPPTVKFEDSPAESLISVPGDMFPSLFATRDSSVALDAMTPTSVLDEPDVDVTLLSSLATAVPTPGSAATSTEKKAVKKRKSWGQVLPEPKTNLPPRKRAKTDDEKEQRRVERVLRNRRAAQSSRERKRQEVEALEHRTKQLEVLLHQLHQTNVKLVGELEKYKREAGVTTHSQPTLGQLASNPLTLSHELFSSQDGHQLPLGSTNDLISQLGLPDRVGDTVNPASLSPELHPVPDSVAEAADDEQVKAEEPTPSLAETSLDVTQHPAVSVDASVVARLAGVPEANFSGPEPLRVPGHDVDHCVDVSLSLSAALVADRLGFESGIMSPPDTFNFEHDHMVGDSAPPLQDFDISEFLAEELPSAPEFREHCPDLFELETSVSTENPNLQPHSGASSLGCDDGGIAVGL